VAAEVGRSTARRRGRSREEGAPAGEKIVACTRRIEPAAYENARTTPAAAFQARTRGNLLRLDARLMKGRVEIARKRSASNMKRLLAVSGLALAALLISTLAASAQERGPIARPDRAATPAARLEGIVRCLSIVNLSAEQKTAIAGIVAAARPSLEADAQALRADRE